MLQKKEILTPKEAFEKLIDGKVFNGNTSLTNKETGFLATGIPVGHPVNTEVPANTVMGMPNAQVVGYQNINMVYLNGDIVPYGYASPGNDIKILEIFEGMLLVLVPIGNGPEGNGTWSIGYFETSVLGNGLEIRANNIVWNNGNDKIVVDANGNEIYRLPATQTIQFLYETRSSEYFCILFNGNGGELQTGYVLYNEGKFEREPYLRTGGLQAPTIANNTPVYTPTHTPTHTPDKKISIPHPKGTNANASQIFTLCKAANWTTEAICGMLGNLSWESYLNPIEGQIGGGGGYGLAQWTYSDLQTYAQQAGVTDYTTIPGQIAVIIYQMNNNGGGQYFWRQNTPSGTAIPQGFWLTSTDFTSSSNTASSLAKTWMYYYEAPGVEDTYNRVQGAKYWYDYFS